MKERKEGKSESEREKERGRKEERAGKVSTHDSNLCDCLSTVFQQVLCLPWVNPRDSNKQLTRQTQGHGGLRLLNLSWREEKMKKKWENEIKIVHNWTNGTALHLQTAVGMSVWKIWVFVSFFSQCAASQIFPSGPFLASTNSEKNMIHKLQ